MTHQEDDSIKVMQGTRVEIELIDEAGRPEGMVLDLVPDEDADLEAGLLGVGTPLARVIRGQGAGCTVPYRAGDIVAVKILSVTYSRRDPAEAGAAAGRQAVLQKAVSRSDLAEAVRFASTVNQKWGDTDPEGIAANWDDSTPTTTGPGG